MYSQKIVEIAILLTFSSIKKKKKILKLSKDWPTQAFDFHCLANDKTVDFKSNSILMPIFIAIIHKNPFTYKCNFNYDLKFITFLRTDD